MISIFKWRNWITFIKQVLVKDKLFAFNENFIIFLHDFEIHWIFEWIETKFLHTKKNVENE